MEYTNLHHLVLVTFVASSSQSYLNGLFAWEVSPDIRSLTIPVGICLLKVDNRDTRTRCEICSNM